MEHASADAPKVLRSSTIRTWIRTNLFERTLRKVPRDSGVLDLCCGYGFYFSINPRARGIDGDPECVATLKGRGFDVCFGNVLETLPFDDGVFHHVLAHDVLEHFVMDELDQLFTEVHRVLEPNGTFIAWVPNRLGYDAGVSPLVGHRLFVTGAEIATLAKGRFDVVRHHAEPLPRAIGERFTHNKEVFHLSRL